MLELAGSAADGVLINASDPRDIEECMGYIKRGLKESGRPGKDFDFVAYMPVSIGGDLKRARESAKGVVAFVVSSAPLASLERHGIAPEEVEPIRHQLIAGELKKARLAVTEKMIDAFAMCGSIRDLALRVEELERLGITRTVIGSPMGPEPAKAVQSIAKELF
jgi:5,10-methylenetetrahydromethanopterin reductase